jgi:hypothetical protein
MVTPEEEEAIRKDNEYFMDDYNDKGYMIDAVVVGLIILACGILFIFEILNL